MIHHVFAGRQHSLFLRISIFAASTICLWAFVVKVASAQTPTNMTYKMIGLVTEAPAAQDGYGVWRIEDGDKEYSFVADPTVTFFLSTIPAVGDTVYVEAQIVQGQSRHIVAMMVVDTEPTPPPVQSDLAYATISGSMLTQPPSKNGIGLWQVLARSGRVYRVAVYDASAFTGGMPEQGDDVYVAGWQTESDAVSADTVTIADGGDSIELPAQAVFILSGEIIGEPAGVSDEQLWTLRDGAAVYRVRSNRQTIFTPGPPASGTYVHLLATGHEAAETLLVLEMSENTFSVGEVLVRLQPDVAATTVAERHGLRLDSTALAPVDIYRFTSPNPTIRYLALVLQTLQNDPDVIWAELNFMGALPVEGHPHRVWGWGGPDSTSYEEQTPFDQVKLGNVHRVYRGDAQIVAVLDTGVDLHHWDLEDYLLDGWDMIDHDEQPDDIGPGVAQGHGTHIAGIITRVAPDSQILPVRVLNPDGRGDLFVVAYAIVRSVQQGADIINLSQGTDANSRVLQDVILWAVEQGVTVVAAAGNSDSSALHYPAAYAGVLAVTAVDAHGRKATFANYGPWVDLAAPGVGITSTIVTAQGSGYAAWSGTSMATPFVSGTVALLRGKFPEASVTELNGWLQDTGEVIDERNTQYAGLIGTSLNVEASLQVITTYVPLVIRE